MMANEHTQSEDKLSLLALVGGVLFRPRRAFAYLKENHKKAWWIPALLILALTAAPVIADRAAANRRLSEGLLMEPGMVEPVYGAEGVGVSRGGDPGMMEPSGSQPAALGILTVVGKLAGAIAAWLIWGSALYLTSVFLGRSSSFGDMFRLTVWAGLPHGVRGLVQAAYIFATGEQIVNAGISGLVIDKSVPSSMILPGPGQLALASILGRVDIYMVWSLILFVPGLMAFTGLARRKAFIALFVIWIVLALLSAIPSLFSGMFNVGGTF